MRTNNANQPAAITSVLLAILSFALAGVFAFNNLPMFTFDALIAMLASIITGAYFARRS